MSTKLLDALVEYRLATTESPGYVLLETGTDVNSDLRAATASAVKAAYDRVEAYAPSKTGTNASGTWGIDISGNAATVTDGVYTIGDQSIGGNKTFTDEIVFAGTSGTNALNLNHRIIYHVHRIQFAEPGVSKGLEWEGGNGWKLFESPDNLTNAAGNLQFVTDSTRRCTISTQGDMWVQNNVTASSFSGDGASLTGLDASNLATGTVPDGRISGAYTGITDLSLTGNMTFSGADRVLGTTDAHQLSLRTNSTDRIRVLSTGQVGIGTEHTPSTSYQLDVLGSVRADGDVSVTGSISADGNVSVTGSISADGNVSVTGSVSVPNDGDFVMSGKPMRPATGLHWNKTTNRLGINTMTPSYALDVFGKIYSSDDIVAFSDGRYKTDVRIVSNALDKVSNMRGVTFAMIEDATRRSRVGLIAQEVEAVVPEAVTTDEASGKKAVAYGNLVGVLVEAIKELDCRWSEARTAAKELNDTVKNLQEKVAALERRNEPPT